MENRKKEMKDEIRVQREEFEKEMQKKKDAL